MGTKVKKEEELELRRTEEQDQNQGISTTLEERSNVVSPEAKTKVSSPLREDASSPIDEKVSTRSIVVTPNPKTDNGCTAVNNSKKTQMEQTDGPRKKQKPNAD